MVYIKVKQSLFTWKAKRDNDMIKSKPRKLRTATVIDSCFDLVGSRQHGVVAASRIKAISRLLDLG